MGKAGNFCGLNLYLGDDGYNCYRDIQNAQIGGGSLFKMHEELLQQNCLQLALGELFDLSVDEFDEVYAYKYDRRVSRRGKNAYPQFLKLEKNCYPWRISKEEEMILLGDAIHAAVLLAEEYDRTKKVKKVIPGQYELNFDTNALNENAGYPFEVPEVKEDSKKVPFATCVDGT